MLRVLLAKGPIEDLLLLLLCVKFTFLSNSTHVVHVTATFVVGLRKSNLISPVSSCSHNVTVPHLFLYHLIHAITYFPPTETAKQRRDIYQAAVRYRPAHCNRAANITKHFFILTLFRIFPEVSALVPSLVRSVQQQALAVQYLKPTLLAVIYTGIAC